MKPLALVTPLIGGVIAFINILAIIYHARLTLSSLVTLPILDVFAIVGLVIYLRIPDTPTERAP